eukprot:1385511-Rhodomonas_salina.3
MIPLRPSVLRICDAMSGTDISFALLAIAVCGVRLCDYAMSGTEICYAGASYKEKWDQPVWQVLTSAKLF